MINPPKIGLVFAIHKTSVKSEDVSAKFNKTADIGAPNMKAQSIKTTSKKTVKPAAKSAAQAKSPKIKSSSKSSAPKFSEQTFRYFDLAKKNKAKKEWFEKNKAMYEDHVKAPLSHYIQLLKHELGSDLKRILIDPKKITRPLRPSNKAQDLGWIKDHTHVTLWENKTSIYEWNPAIHFQLGTKPDDNLMGVGLYMISSRQIYRLRAAAFEDYVNLDEIVEDPKFRSRWGQDFGERYKRFPKGYELDHPAAKYIWYKQFYVGQNFTRKQVISPGFIPRAVEDLKLALPFFNWVRTAVGTYQRKLD